MKSGLNEVSIDSTSEIESGLASFAPYYIEEKNVELLNNLFQEETLWRDLNDSHKLGTALEQESIPGDSIANRTVTSSLSDFWEVMNQRYIYPDERLSRDHESRPTSITRNKLLSAAHQSRLINSAYNTHRHPSSKSRVRSNNNGRMTPIPMTHGHLNRPSTFSPSNKMKLKPFVLKSPPRVTQSSIPPQDAIVPDYLVHLDPLSLNVTTTLKGLGKIEQESFKNKRKYSYQSEISDFSEQRGRNISFDGTIASVDDQTHTSHNSCEDESAANSYFTRNDKKYQKQKISAEKLMDMTFMRNFFLQKATLADTHDLICRMQVE